LARASSGNRRLASVRRMLVSCRCWIGWRMR
jgi:hypothetical protein